MTKPSNPRQRPRVEHRVPPPLVQRTNAPHLPGLDLLEDETSPAGLIFWQAFRDAELWAKASERDGLFQPGPIEDSPVHDLDADTYAAAIPYLSVLQRVTAATTTVSQDAVRHACGELANWFEGRGLLRCAVQFAVVAYLTAPSDALFVVRVARLLRMLGEYPRAISWFDYSLYVARQTEDWPAFAKALAGLGVLHYQRGNYPRARQLQHRCIRVARRFGLRDMAGEAFHNLFVLEMDAGDVPLAESYAAKALRAYSPKSSSMIRLARDLAHKWTLAGEYHISLPLELEALHHFTRVPDRAQVWAGVGRAAGGTGNWPVFEEAWLETWHLVRAGLVEQVASVVLMDLAHGAALLGDAHRAAHAAANALEIARRRAEGHTALDAETFLARLDPLARDASSPQTAPDAQLPQLASDLLGVLRARRAVAA